MLHQGFKALRANAAGVSRRAAEAARHKISHLCDHLELLSQARTEHPDAMCYLGRLGNKTRRGFRKGCTGKTFYRKYEEQRETKMLQELEKAMVDLVGGE